MGFAVLSPTYALYKPGFTLEQALAEIKVLACKIPEGGLLAAFIEGSQRGVIR